jgi:glycosyltransferase involved in cell wall biosynthesis
MRVLLITQWYPPEPQKVVSDIAEMLQAQGHSVTVLTGFPNYPSGKVYPGYRIRLWRKEQLNGISVVRVALYPNHGSSPVKRALNFLSFAFSLFFLGPWLVPRSDVVHLYLPPLTIGMAGWLISRLHGAALTCEIQDMWPETLKATGMVNSDRVLRWIGWAADWLYWRCRSIRVISPGFRRNLLAKGVPSEKIHVIPNWVDTDFYKPMAANPELAKSLGLAGRFNVLFAGVIGRAQGLDVVLDAASLLQDDPNIQFVFIGDGLEMPRLQKAASERGIENVKFLGRFPEIKMAGLLALADVLFVHLRDDPLFRITIPHKIYTYMASAKPILAAMEGDVADAVRTAGAGLTCPADNPQALAETVRAFLRLSPAERQTMAENGRAHACDGLSRVRLVGQLEEMLERSRSWS